MKPSHKHLIALPLVAVALIAAGCGSDADDGGSGEPSTAAATGEAAPVAEKGLPKALAANRAEANEILEEGQLQSKLDELKGHPVVVNQWGSWCPPCREEFPFFAAAAEAHADEIAFLGIDMEDNREAAEQFLSESPVPYPSIFDPSAEEIRSLGGGVVSPTTVFIDETGEIVNVFQGPYTSQEQLERDIERHLQS
jgi:thiol-disulfide isomerase/thioredoxin